jgi:hypothetical protein
MKKTQVFYRLREIRRVREDFSDRPRAGRPPQAGLDTVLAHELEPDSHTPAGAGSVSGCFSLNNPESPARELGDEGR